MKHNVLIKGIGIYFPKMIELSLVKHVCRYTQTDSIIIRIESLVVNYIIKIRRQEVYIILTSSLEYRQKKGFAVRHQHYNGTVKTFQNNL